CSAPLPLPAPVDPPKEKVGLIDHQLLFSVHQWAIQDHLSAFTWDADMAFKRNGNNCLLCIWLITTSSFKY
ncbi:hypothetical protein RRG08_022188, partial [Elysia crispata]